MISPGSIIYYIYSLWNFVFEAVLLELKLLSSLVTVAGKHTEKHFLLHVAVAKAKLA